MCGLRTVWQTALLEKLIKQIKALLIYKHNSVVAYMFCRQKVLDSVLGEDSCQTARQSRQNWTRWTNSLRYVYTQLPMYTWGSCNEAQFKLELDIRYYTHTPCQYKSQASYVYNLVPGEKQTGLWQEYTYSMVLCIPLILSCPCYHRERTKSQRKPPVGGQDWL